MENGCPMITRWLVTNNGSQIFASLFNKTTSFKYNSFLALTVSYGKVSCEED